MNDGEFTRQNREAVSYLWVGSKAGDRETIGKFGIGMKSVFHLCEAFFYLASPNQPGSEGAPFAQVLNPWSGSGIHDDWDTLPVRDVLTMGDAIESWRPGRERWFCVWLPLRRAAQLGGKAAIKDVFPEPTEVAGGDPWTHVGRVMPLLRWLSEVEYWECTEPQNPPRRVRRLVLEPHGGRRAFPDPALTAGVQVGLGGTLRHEATTGSVVVRYSGLEAVFADDRLQRIGAEQQWPRHATVDRTTGRVVLEEDRAEAHGAAVWIGPIVEEGSPPDLRLGDAVFLPLPSKPAASRSRIGGRVEALLHGWFFVDSSRSERPGLDGFERTASPHESVQVRWNRALAARVDGLVLPSLDAFVRDASLSFEQTTALTEALRELRSDSLASLAIDHDWLAVATGGELEWRLLRHGTAFWEVPGDGPDDLRRARRLFPSLCSRFADRPVTLDSLPRIANGDPESWSGDEAGWGELLGVPRSVVNEAASVRYFATLLRAERSRFASSLWQDRSGAPAAWLAAALPELGDRVDKDVLAAIRQLVQALAPEAWLALDWVWSRSRSLAAALGNAGLSRVLLPQDVCPEARPFGGLLPLDDAERALRAVGALAMDGAAAVRARASLAAKIVALTAGDSAEKLTRLGNLEVFGVTEVATGREVPITWNGLLELRAQGRLFAHTRDLALELQQALATLELFTVSKWAEDLLGAAQPEACRAAACARVLARAPQLAPAPARARLLEALLPHVAGDPEVRQAVRYLLHADPGHVADRSRLFADQYGRAEHSSALRKMCALTLRESGEAWRLVNPGLTAKLSREHEDVLGVRPLDWAAVADVLRRIGPASVSALELTTEERADVLGALDAEDVWEALPLHETVHGDLVALRPGETFLAGDLPLPPALEGSVTLLRAPQDPRHLALYQNRGVARWNSRQLLERALLHDCPAELWAEILDTIARSGSEGPPPDVASKLRDTPWLPLDGGVAPRSVVCLPELGDELERLLGEPEVAGAFLTPGRFPEAVRNHGGFRWLEVHGFASGREALEIVGLALGSVEGFRIGEIAALRRSPEVTDKLLDAFAGAASQVAPLRLLESVRASMGRGPARALAAELVGPAPVPALVQQLELLAAEYERRERRARPLIAEVHGWFLEALVLAEEFELVALREVRLLNQRGQWRPASELCTEEDGVDPAFVLDGDQARVIGAAAASRQAPRAPSSPSPVRGLSGAAALEACFAGWADTLTGREVVGAFLAVLGDDPAVRVFAQRFLQPTHTVEGIRDRLPWEEARGPSLSADLTGFSGGLGRPLGIEESRLALLAGLRAGDALGRQKYAIELVAGAQEIRVPNVLGEEIVVPLSTSAATLLAGKLTFDRCSGPDLGPIRVRLRRVPPEDKAPRQLVALLCATAEEILRRAFGQPNVQLGELFEQLSHSEQEEIGVAQRLILEAAFFYFRQLRDRPDSRLRSLCKDWDQLRYEKAEAERLGPEAGSRRHAALERRRGELMGKLQALAESDAAFQEDALEGVRTKVREFQYTPSSVLFELFQNADDAARELEDLGASTPSASHAVLRWRADEVLFAHWGRAINRYRFGELQRHEARGFHRDLEKMLVLSSSDKTEANGVTGRFGLGFKSTLLVADAPRVVSGRLHFETVGGFFPRRLAEKESQRLQDIARGFGDAASATVTALAPLRVGVDEVVRPFLDVVHVLVVFARRITRLTVAGPDGLKAQATWNPVLVPGVEGAAVGELTPVSAKPDARSTALLLGTDAGGVLLGLGPRGFRRLPKSLPTLWVTAPTAERLEAGIAVNAPFAVDVGRTQLASGEANCLVAERMASALGQQLLDLHASSSHWDGLASALRLASDTTPYRLWGSLWEVLSEAVNLDARATASAGNVVLRKILWDRGGAATRLFEERDVLPSGLDGAFACLLQAGLAKYSVRGLLTAGHILHAVSEWPSVRKRLVPGNTVNHQAVASKLSQLVPLAHVPEQVTLAAALRWELDDDSDVDPERAAAIGRVLDDDIEKRLKDGGEWPAIEDQLRRLRLLAEEGGYRAADELLCSDAGKEDALLVGFAPAEFVLSRKYSESALGLFELARSRPSASAPLIARWCREARGETSRRAVIKYLVRGEKAPAVRRQFEEGGRPDWIRPDSPSLEGLSDAEKTQALGNAGFGLSELQSSGAKRSVPARPPEGGLQKIRRWWGRPAHC